MNLNSNPSDKKMPCKTVVVTDYVNRKILVLYTSDNKHFQNEYTNVFIVIEVDLLIQDYPYLRYNEGSSILQDEEGEVQPTKTLKYYL